jgi:hypothetical protein
MESERYWNNGILGRRMNDKNPTFQYSIIPFSHYPIFPSFQSFNLFLCGLGALCGKQEFEIADWRIILPR